MNSKVSFNKNQDKKQNNIIKWVIILVVVLTILWIVSFFYNRESVIVSYYEPKPEAQSSRFYATKFLLQKQGKTVELLGDTDDILLREIWADTNNAAKKTLIIQDIKPEQTTDVKHMLDWVLAGGHIVSFPNEYWYSDHTDINQITDYYNQENPLLLALGVSANLYSPDYYHDGDDDKTKEKKSEIIDKFNYGAIPLKLPTGERIVIESDSYPRIIFNNEFTKTYDKLKNSDNTEMGKIRQFYDEHQLVRNQVKPIDYNLLTHHEPTNQQTLSGLTANEKTDILTMQSYVNDHFSPNRIIYDVKVGAGRITLLASDDIFKNPTANNSLTHTSATPPTKTTTHTPFYQKLTNHDWHDNAVYNGGIMSVDNAFFTNYLTQNSDKVWIVANFKRPTLMQLLWANVPFLLIALGLVVILGLLALPKQFGAIRTYQDDAAFNLFRFFDEMGNFLWRTDKMYKQVEKNRMILLEKYMARLPHLSKLNENQVCDEIAELTHIDVSVVEMALYGEWRNDKEFLVITQSLYRLERFLER